jgi:hypothetical protein
MLILSRRLILSLAVFDSQKKTPRATFLLDEPLESPATTSKDEETLALGQLPLKIRSNPRLNRHGGRNYRGYS